MSGDLGQWVQWATSAIVALGTVIGTLRLLTVRADKRKLAAETGNVDADSQVKLSTETRELAKEWKTAAQEAKAEARKCREENDSLAKRVDALADQHEALQERYEDLVNRITSCSAGSICPVADSLSP